jgi:DNA-binding protein HU-beta
MAEIANAGAKAAAPKAKVETMSSRQLAQQLAEKHELTKKQANAIMDDLAAIITKQLKKGTRIRLNGLGVLQVRKRAARMGRNPATGEAIKIKASKKVAFRVSKELNPLREGRSRASRFGEGCRHIPLPEISRLRTRIFNPPPSGGLK